MAENSERVKNAVGWYVKLSSEDASSTDQQAWATWINQSKQNASAWEEVISMLSKFQSIPSEVGMSVLNRNSKKFDLHRRTTLKNFALFAAVALPTGLLFKDSLMRELYFDYSTKVGERKQVMLSDGTRLVLNTDSAVKVNFTLSQRTIRLLQGEMLITTGHENIFDRPLLIETPDGSVVPMGTRFNVRKFEAFTRISLYEGKLKVTPKYNDVNFLMHSKEEVDLSTLDVVQSAAELKLSDAWLNGYIEVNNLTLKMFIDELARYQQGLLLCHQDIQNLRISGAYSVDDIDTSLNSLSQTFPIKIQRATRFLTMLFPVA